MSHVQQQLIGRVIVALANLPGVGSRVWRSSVHPLTPACMPGVIVELGKERNAGGTLDATTKAVDLLIGVYVEGNDLVVSTEILAAIEAALYGDYADGRYLDGLALSLVYGSSERRYVTSSALKHTETRVVYSIEYQTVDGSADVAC